MTKKDFLLSVPPLIDHLSHGLGRLTVVSNGRNDKAASYKHSDGTSSFGACAPTWLEVSQWIANSLKEKSALIK